MPVVRELMAVVTLVALVPTLLVQHYAAPIGTGSDAHVAAGTAQFLKHAYPTGVDVSEPINQMPPTWQSKYPIYYAFAGVSSLSGLATWQVLATLAAAMLGLAAVGMFLVAREVLGALVVLQRNSGYRLYRESPAVPGPDTCSQRRFDRIYTGVGFNPR